MLYFIHVHKCGGHSTYHALKHLIGKDNVFWIDGLKWHEEEERYKELTNSEKDEYHAVIGHMLYGYHRYYSSDKTYK